MSIERTFPPIVKLMDDGLQKEIDRETEIWNKRTWAGTKLDRLPLSPSQIGKCSLALARNLAHYLGLADYPRTPASVSPRVKRIFSRGELIEGALVGDFRTYTGLDVKDRQLRVRLFSLDEKLWVEGNIDGIAVEEVGGVRILVDYKSKGAFYSAAFQDSINEFFAELRQTGTVEELYPGCFLITDPDKLFEVISLDEFFVDYLLQLNSYAFAKEVGKVDFVALYYENKNTCAHYEVRWKPSAGLYGYARDKFQFIYDTVRTKGPETVPKEFSLGSARCRLCDYNETCWGKYEPKPNGSRVFGKLEPALDSALRAAQRDHHVVAKVEEQVLAEMQRQDATHIQTSDGLTYERKFLKSPKPHYELRLSK